MTWTIYLLVFLSSAVLVQAQTTESLVSKWEKDMMHFIESYNENNETYKPELIRDTAWFTINSTVNFKLEIYAQNVECWKCPLVHVVEIDESNTTTILANTTFKTKMSIRRKMSEDHEEVICSFTYQFIDEGDYWLFMNYTTWKDAICEIVLANEPHNPYLPIPFTIGGLIVLAIAWTIIKYIYKSEKLQITSCCGKTADITSPDQLTESNSHNNSSINLQHYGGENNHKVNGDVENGNVKDASFISKEDPPPPAKKKRLRSLDTFRGISLVIMIFVNYGGGGYWFFDHPYWNGLTVADMVFPWFIFIMGTSMNYSFRSLLRKKTPRYKIFIFKVFKRSFILFALGIIYNTAGGRADMEKLRIPGVLQRFAGTYFILATIEMFFAREEDSHQEKRWAPIRDVLNYWPVWLLNLLILGIHLALTFGLPVPNCPTGYLGPGGISEGGAHYNCSGGAAHYIDTLILGEDHMYQWPTLKTVYHTKLPFDPEGLLGTLTSVFMCFLGLQAGRVLLTFDGHLSRTLRWLAWAVITGFIALILCRWSQNDGWIPINKNLWSVSFVMVTACFAYIFLCFLYVLIDVLEWWDGTPFVYPGMNSIVIYMLHGVFHHYFPITWVVEEQHWRLLLQEIWGTAIWVFVAYLMFKRKIFVAI